MERPDIVAGLKNAVDRGYSIDLAIQSFISAGYNKQDVFDSAASIGGVMMQHPQLSQPQIHPLPQPQSSREIKQNLQQSQLNQSAMTPITQPMPSLPSQPLPQIQIINKKSNKNILLVIILVVVLVVLLSILGITIFARDWISSLIGLK